MFPVCRLPKFKIHLEVFHKGVSIHKHTEDGHSWTRNAYSLAYNFMLCLTETTNTYGNGFFKCKDMSGNVENGDNIASADEAGYGLMGAAGADTYGILVGTGNTAFTFDDFALATKIANGSTSLKIEYAVMGAAVKTWDLPTLTWTISWNRYFSNNSTAQITVKETGIAYSTGPWLIARDVLATPIDVPDDGQLLVTYEFEQTLPA